MITRCSVLHLKIEDQQIQIFQRKKDQQIHVSLHLLCSSFRMMFISWVQELDFSVSDANTTNTCRIGLKSRPAPASSCWATRAAPRPPPQPLASSSPCPRRRRSCRRKSGEQRGGRRRGHQLAPHLSILSQPLPSFPSSLLPAAPWTWPAASSSPELGRSAWGKAGSACVDAGSVLSGLVQRGREAAPFGMPVGVSGLRGGQAPRRGRRRLLRPRLTRPPSRQRLVSVVTRPCDHGGC